VKQKFLGKMLTGLSKMNQRNSVKFDYFEANEKIKKDANKESHFKEQNIVSKRVSSQFL
jgi:hypothetical protein